jgi:hypothetical protein
VPSSSRLSRTDILRLFRLLDAELEKSAITGEVYLVGGAIMCLAFDARASNADVDALFLPATEIRAAARRVAAKADAPVDWLNDAVKGLMGTRGDFNEYLELPNLRVYIARPEYLLAMKCASMRLGAEFHDLDDVRFLLRYLNIERVDAALETVTRYFDEAQLPAKTRLALEELLAPQE